MFNRCPNSVKATLVLSVFLASCATGGLKQKYGDCELNREQAQMLADIKEMQQSIDQKSERFDRELTKGPVELYSNENYQEILTLKYERDEALNYLAKSLAGNTVCLQALFKKDLNFPVLIDEK